MLNNEICPFGQPDMHDPALKTYPLEQTRHPVDEQFKHPFEHSLHIEPSEYVPEGQLLVQLLLKSKLNPAEQERQ